MPLAPSPLLILANIGAILALVMMMLGVGLAVGPNLRALPRALDRRTALCAIGANLVAVPLLSAGLLMTAEPQPAVAAAILLLACFPAGPISLMFVNQDSDSLVRSTAVVLLLQFVSVIVSPILLLTLGRAVLGEPIVAHPRTAAVSMASQMLFLEIAPIFAGAWLSSRVTNGQERLRRVLRLVAMAALGVAGLGFGSLYLGSFGEDWSEALQLAAALLLVSWVAAMTLRGKASKHDSTQIAGLRNVSLSIVVAGTMPSLRDSVVFVLLGAGVVTAGAPVLRLFRRATRTATA